MDCPKCEGPLLRRELESAVVDECQDCCGIWFDRDELRRAKDAAEPDANWLDFELWKNSERLSGAPATIECPGCGLKLVALTYADTGVEIDHCATCEGTWLDKGEFEKIIDALSNEIVTKSAPDYVRAVIEGAKEIVTGPETLLSEWNDFTTVLRLMQYRLLAENPKVADAIAEVQRSSPIR
jgi:Zn-finger nucleic acid-binding protein